MTQETVVHCFKKADITFEAQRTVIADSVNPIKGLQESIDTLKADDPDMVLESLSAENVIATLTMVLLRLLHVLPRITF